MLSSPPRNEEEFLPKTIHCMEASLSGPRNGILVDDGSTDASSQIVDAAAGDTSGSPPFTAKIGDTASGGRRN